MKAAVIPSVSEGSGRVCGAESINFSRRTPAHPDPSLTLLRNSQVLCDFGGRNDVRKTSIATVSLFLADERRAGRCDEVDHDANPGLRSPSARWPKATVSQPLRGDPPRTRAGFLCSRSALAQQLRSG